MAQYKAFDSIGNQLSTLTQLIDIVSEDISGSITRRKYQVFVTGGIGPGITSSQYQTVYDQDWRLQTANSVFDISFGLISGSYGLGGKTGASKTFTGSWTGTDTSGKMLFSSQSVMMREKMYNYQEMAQVLLGDKDKKFTIPYRSTGTTLMGTDDRTVKVPMFLSFKRLFHRDGIKKETFAMKFYQSASHISKVESETVGIRKPNLWQHSLSGSKVFTDVGSSTAYAATPTAGDVGIIRDSSDTSRKVGLLWYQKGFAMLDLELITSGAQHMSGAIRAMNATAPGGEAETRTGYMLMGSPRSGNQYAKLIPDFVVSASMDDVIDHLASTRFCSGSTAAITFQNETMINSTLYYCRLAPDDFNYSTNPSYVDDDGRLVVIDPGQESKQESFAFVTTIYGCNAEGEPMWCAKLNRPIEKNMSKDIIIKVRLDY